MPKVADSPDELAAVLVEAERAVGDPERTAGSVRQLGRRQQAAYHQLVKTPKWHDRVLAATPEAVRPVIQRNLDAAKALERLVRPASGLPPWRISAPAPAGELLGYYKEAEARFGVPWQYLAAINLVETRFGRIEGTSSAGAKGPMQFIPSTWESYGNGGDITETRDAILGAGRYLKASGAPEDMAAALLAYNRSTAYMKAVSAYASQMIDNPATFKGYYHWQVYYARSGGTVVLPTGFQG